VVKPSRPAADRTIDALRAVFVSAVVLIHVYDPALLHPARYSPGEHFLLACYQVLTRVSVPGFVLLSGLLLVGSQEQRALRWGAFVRRRVGRVLPAYLVWSAVYALRAGLRWPQAVESALTGTACYHLFFVPAILHLYLVFPLLRRLLARWSGSVRAALGACVLALALAPLVERGYGWARAALGTEHLLARYLAGGPLEALRWLPYFVCGIVLAPWRGALLAPHDPPARRRWPVLVALAVVAGLVARNVRLIPTVPDGALTIASQTFSWAGPYSSLACAAMLVLVVSALTRADAQRMVRALALLGPASYGVYLGHVLVLQELSRHLVAFRLLAWLPGSMPLAAALVVLLTWPLALSWRREWPAGSAALAANDA
jgi:surface polysaccharide O-acyltransferase-like enzyme